MTVFAVAVGGAFGAVARYGVSIWMMQQFGGGFPWGTLAVNLVGCFLLGLLDGFVVSGQLVSAEARLLLGTGFLGALTTFSTFSVETIRAFEVGQVARCRRVPGRELDWRPRAGRAWSYIGHENGGRRLMR